MILPTGCNNHKPKSLLIVSHYCLRQMTSFLSNSVKILAKCLHTFWIYHPKKNNTYEIIVINANKSFNVQSKQTNRKKKKLRAELNLIYDQIMNITCDNYYIQYFGKLSIQNKGQYTI